MSLLLLFRPRQGGTTHEGSNLGTSYAFNIFVNGVRTRLGSLAVPLSFNIATNGVRVSFGSASVPLSFNFGTNGTFTKVGVVSVPLSLNIATAAKASYFGTVTFPLTFGISTRGEIEGQTDESERLRVDKEPLPREPWPKTPSGNPILVQIKPKPEWMRRKN
jgi:hypothetical protein